MERADVGRYTPSGRRNATHLDVNKVTDLEFRDGDTERL